MLKRLGQKKSPGVGAKLSAQFEKVSEKSREHLCAKSGFFAEIKKSLKILKFSDF